MEGADTNGGLCIVSFRRKATGANADGRRSGVQWKEIGDGMNISYEPLPSYGTGWRDGLHWMEELDAWGRAYEEREMVPNVSNKQTAQETVEMLLYTVPDMLKPMGRNIVSAVMDDRLRKAMM